MSQRHEVVRGEKSCRSKAWCLLEFSERLVSYADPSPDLRTFQHLTWGNDSYPVLKSICFSWFDRFLLQSELTAVLSICKHCKRPCFDPCGGDVEGSQLKGGGAQPHQNKVTNDSLSFLHYTIVFFNYTHILKYQQYKISIINMSNKSGATGAVTWVTSTAG